MPAPISDLGRSLCQHVHTHVTLALVYQEPLESAYAILHLLPASY